MTPLLLWPPSPWQLLRQAGPLPFWLFCFLLSINNKNLRSHTWGLSRLSIWNWNFPTNFQSPLQSKQTWVGFGFSYPKSKIQIQNPGFWSGFKILFSGWILDLDLNPFFGRGFPNPFLNPFCKGKYHFTIFPPPFSILSAFLQFQIWSKHVAYIWFDTGQK